jgi:uncharacterized protein YdaU (DUF1376 family)
MPLYVNDYHADTAHLSVEEHGAYLLLIMNYWHHGGLPNDEEKLRRIAKMTARQWAKSAETLKSFFQEQWKHKRIEEELAHVLEVSRARSANAKQKPSKKSAKVYTLHTSQPLANANGARKRAIPFPENFVLGDEQRAAADRHGIPAARVAGVFEHFRDHHTARGSVMKDWNAAWRTWCKNDLRFKGGRNGSGNDRKDEWIGAQQAAGDFGRSGNPDPWPVSKGWPEAGG